MQIDAGALNQRIQIVRVSTDRDADGYVTRSESVIRSPWAQFSQPSGTELIRSGAEMEQVNGRFLIRWTATELSRKDLVRYRGQDWNIQYINPYGDSREFLELICARATAEG